MADAFASFFKCNYELPAISLDSPSSDVGSSVCHVNNLVLSESKVSSAILHLKLKHTVGPDGIPSFLIRKCNRGLVGPLTVLFNLFLKMRIFPSMWKVTRVTPILKSGDKSMVINYRPIAVLSNISKVFEVCIFNHISRAVMHAITPRQHGFVRSRSVLTNLACFMQFAGSSLDIGSQVDEVYMDFAKAFDKLSHAILLVKLANRYGFHSNLLEFLNSYLTNRRTYVEVRESQFSSNVATSGVF